MRKTERVVLYWAGVTHFFGYFHKKGRGGSSNEKGCYHEKLRFFGLFVKGGGGHNPKIWVFQIKFGGSLDFGEILQLFLAHLNEERMADTWKLLTILQNAGQPARPHASN